jgi:hypothetical protein
MRSRAGEMGKPESATGAKRVGCVREPANLHVITR